METPIQNEPEYKNKAAYLRSVMRRAIEEANKLDIDEPLLVIPKEWGEAE